MCNFFSLVSDPAKQKIMYSDWNVRQLCLSGELDFNPDSHTAIANSHGYNARREESLNRYEYNPLTREFTVDQLCHEWDDSASVERYCNELDFSKIVPAMVVKPIVYPFLIQPPAKITAEHLALLKKWNSVRKSVRDVKDSVWTSVWTSVGSDVGGTVWNSVKSSIRVSLWDYVWDLMWAYNSSFFLIKRWKYINHEPGVNPFQSAIDLWEMGLVPSFYRQTWRLLGGKAANVLWKDNDQVDFF